MSWPACPTCGKPLPRLWRNKAKGLRLQFCSTGCIPRAVRAAGGRKGRIGAMQRARLASFQGELQRLRSLPRITGDELMASFATVAARAYDNGYSSCETKWLRRRSSAA